MNRNYLHGTLALLAAGLLCASLNIVEIVAPGRLPSTIDYPSA